MLNSIIKFAIFIGIVGALAVGVNYLLTAPEGDGVVITFREQEWTLRPLMFAGLVLGGFAALWLALKVTGIGIAVFNFIMGDETAFSRYFERNRERKGTEALAGAHAAIVSGDLRRAKQKAQRAERMLQRPELTRLTMAQTAELAGEPVRAKTYYKALSDNPETALVGVKGLLRIAESEGDRDTALILARTAAGLKADDKETLETLYTLQSQAFDWEGARVTLGSLKRAGQIAEGEANRREAMLALAQAEDSADAGRGGEALKLAVESAKIDPTNVDAVTKAAAMLDETGATKQAARVLADAWKAAPSPRLAAAFAALEPDETAVDRRSRFDTLFEANPDHAQSHYTSAELALATGDLKGAREHLRKTNETEPSARYCTIMAAITRAEGKPDSESRTWLVRAIDAPGTAKGMITEPSMLPMLVGGSAAAAEPPAPPPPALEAPKADTAEPEAAEAAEEKAVS